MSGIGNAKSTQSANVYYGEHSLGSKTLARSDQPYDSNAKSSDIQQKNVERVTDAPVVFRVPKTDRWKRVRRTG